jgi:hypothetical protein
MLSDRGWERSLSVGKRSRFHWYEPGAAVSLCGQIWRDYEVSEGTEGSEMNCRECLKRRNHVGERSVQDATD